MSVASEITRLQGAKASIKSAIEAKGVTVPSNALLDSFATYIAQISGGGSTGLDYETGTFTPSTDVAKPEISFSRAHTSPPVFYSIYDVTNTIQPNNSCIAVNYVDSYKLFGAGYVYTSSSPAMRYGTAQYLYRGSSSTSISSGTAHFTSSSDVPLPSSGGSVSYARYWATESKLTPSSNSSTRYFVSGRSYKWIAIWK